MPSGEDALVLLALLVSPLAHVPYPGNDNPLVDVVVSAGLVTTFGLDEGVSTCGKIGLCLRK